MRCIEKWYGLIDSVGLEILYFKLFRGATGYQKLKTHVSRDECLMPAQAPTAKYCLCPQNAGLVDVEYPLNSRESVRHGRGLAKD